MGNNRRSEEYGVLIDQQLYSLADKFKQYIPPKDFEKLIPAIHEAQTILQLEYNKIKSPTEATQERKDISDGKH